MDLNGGQITDNLNNSGPLSGSSRKATSQKKTATVDISFMFSGRILLIELIV